MRILILYMELAGYVMACLRALGKVPGVEILLISWPVNQEAPFEFQEEKNIQKLGRNSQPEAQLEKRIEDFSPDIVFISGWVDTWYKQIATKYKKRGVPTIVGADNQWVNSLKQKVASFLSPLLLKPAFSHFWVPGPRQYAFASRLGYEAKQIKTGYYSADVSLFMEKGLERKAQRAFPKRLIYVGRLVPDKGVSNLLKAFQELGDAGWELWLAGIGALEAEAQRIEGVRCLGFVQPDELPDILSQCGAGILPSMKEPWGVVLHEYVASGLPVIVSDNCGAAESFLKTGYNGWKFEAGNTSSLLGALQKLTSCKEDKLIEMGERSRSLALQITPEIWAQTLLSLAES